MEILRDVKLLRAEVKVLHFLLTFFLSNHYIYRTSLLMSEYRFDRSLFKIQTFKEADRENIFDKNILYTERLGQA